MKFSADACLSAVMAGDILQINLPSLQRHPNVQHVPQELRRALPIESTE
jgi:hypothetical protein